jgi:hypothetical protein
MKHNHVWQKQTQPTQPMLNRLSGQHVGETETAHQPEIKIPVALVYRCWELSIKKGAH